MSGETPLTVPPCPVREEIRGAGDLQIESVLPMLFARPRRGAGFPKTALLDFGCGDGSLLRGLQTFPPDMLQKIRYVGVDSDREKVEAARAASREKGELTPKFRCIADLLQECRIDTVEDFNSSPPPRESFHIVNVMNVVHHLHAQKHLSWVLSALFEYTSPWGYLVFHDLFLGDYPTNVHTGIYRCDDAVYFGPGELSMALRPVFGERPMFRFFKRLRGYPEKAKPRSPWFGYTFVLKKYDSGWGLLDEFGFYMGAYRGVCKMAERAARAAHDHTSWYVKYSQRLLRLQSEMEQTPAAMSLDDPDNPTQTRGKLDTIYRFYDPFYS